MFDCLLQTKCLLRLFYDNILNLLMGLLLVLSQFFGLDNPIHVLTPSLKENVFSVPSAYLKLCATYTQTLEY